MPVSHQPIANGIERTIGVLAKCRARFLWRSRVNLQADLVVVDESPQCDERRIASILGGTDVPAEFVKTRKGFSQSYEVQLETDQLRMAVILASDNFRHTEIQPRIPPVVSILALRTNSTNTRHWLE